MIPDASHDYTEWGYHMIGESHNVFGFVPKDNPPQAPHAKSKGNAKRANAAKGGATKSSMLNRIYTSFEHAPP